MARTNKYTSINFNHVLEKNVTSSTPNKAKNPQIHHQNQSCSFSYSSISAAANAKTHGRMLVLTRPSPKPISSPPLVSQTPPKQPQPTSAPAPAPDQASLINPASDQISLRPLGRTGSGTSISGQEKEKEKEAVLVAGSSKPDRFVPPHLRPGSWEKRRALDRKSSGQENRDRSISAQPVDLEKMGVPNQVVMKT